MKCTSTPPIIHRSLRLLPAILSFAAFSSAVVAQGELAPPGNPGPTGKTLQQIEPRTDLATLPGAANYHHVIETPGSYYLSANLDVTLTHGIDIRSSGVSLDLSGHSIRRTGGSGGTGIEVSPGLNCVAIRNGSLEGFGKGISLTNNAACRLTHLRVQGGATGISFNRACQANFVLDCSITGTSDDGIEFVTGDGQGAGGSCHANLIQRCSITKAGGRGIEFDASQTGEASTNGILDSAISGTGSDMEGILFSGGNAKMNANLVNRCSIEGTGGSGVRFIANSAFAEGNILSDLAIARTALHGIELISSSNGDVRGNLIERVTVGDPGSSYVNLEAVQGGSVSYNVVRKCVGRAGGVYGIHCDGGPTGQANGNRLEDNHFTRIPPFLILVPLYAIRTQNCSKNLIRRNTAVGYPNGYLFARGDTWGPVLTSTGAFTLPNSGNGFHPAANLFR